jgi:hypothetical protein
MAMTTFNPLYHPICLAKPQRLAWSAWTQHIPFGMLLIDLIHPKLFVELGTFKGGSYCAFCQAVKLLQVGTRCYAIDTWRGDGHCGFYENEILTGLREHHDPWYSDFSSLIQSTFDNALDQFSDGTIDLLHIDGYHTYDAVRHDFETWLPKMSSHGIIIMHDTNEHNADFGVWQYWDEIKVQYPSFSFLHEHGLGMVAVGTSIPDELQPFFTASANEREALRELFFQLGDRLTTEEENGRLSIQLEQTQYTLAQCEMAMEAALNKGREFAELENSRGVKLVRLARSSRALLASKGPGFLVKRVFLWLIGKRGYYLQHT